LKDVHESIVEYT